ncbi:hypothetical protein MNBD_GAMMA03-891 [hydrothermal vent metagenome]|uniref:RNA polymerase sigma-70 ECF-like HTH domain-containing protein n=1 Tax=hydrothermal vent metagenome TaxID=652676 RepID=A0A3B0W130_9ZZZZ
MHSLENITRFLNNDTLINQDKLDKVFELLYPEVKKIANSQLAKTMQPPDVTPTVLVNECYIRLKNSVSVDLKNRKHFFSLVSRCMRFYLVDLVRQQYSLKNLHTAKLNITQITGDDTFETDIIELDYALDKLERMNTELLNIVELRFFSGFSLDEVAELLGSNKAKIYRKWLLAKAILLNFIDEKNETQT